MISRTGFGVINGFELPSITPADEGSRFIFRRNHRCAMVHRAVDQVCQYIKIEDVFKNGLCKTRRSGSRNTGGMYDADAQFLDVDAQMTGFSNAPDKR